MQKNENPSFSTSQSICLLSLYGRASHQTGYPPTSNFCVSTWCFLQMTEKKMSVWSQVPHALCKQNTYGYKNNILTACSEVYSKSNAIWELKLPTSMMIALWEKAPCSLVEICRRFRDAYFLHHQGDNGGDTHHWNVGLLQLDYAALYPRRLSSSCSPSSEPEISQSNK
jgi:hypothetical protein